MSGHHDFSLHTAPQTEDLKSFRDRLAYPGGKPKIFCTTPVLKLWYNCCK